jgi:hypothetical protein
MADSKVDTYAELVNRLTGHHPGVPRQIVEEQVVKALEGTWLFGEDPTTVELVEVIASENVSRVDRAMRGGADLSDESESATAGP